VRATVIERVRSSWIRQRPEQAEASEWVVVQEWHGEPGGTTTDRFTTHGPTRVSWSLSGSDRSTLLDVYVRDADGRMVKGAVNLPGALKTSAAGSFPMSNEPGVYFMEIHSTNARWRVAVEQASGGRW